MRDNLQMPSQMQLPTDYTKPLQVDCSIEYELPEFASLNSLRNSAPLLIIHPGYFRHADIMRQIRFVNNLPKKMHLPFPEVPLRQSEMEKQSLNKQQSSCCSQPTTFSNYSLSSVDSGIGVSPNCKTNAKAGVYAYDSKQNAYNQGYNGSVSKSMDMSACYLDAFLNWPHPVRTEKQNLKAPVSKRVSESKGNFTSKIYSKKHNAENYSPYKTDYFHHKNIAQTGFGSNGIQNFTQNNCAAAVLNANQHPAVQYCWPVAGLW